MSNQQNPVMWAGAALAAFALAGCGGGSSSSASALTGLSEALDVTDAATFKSLAECIEVPADLPAAGAGALRVASADNSGYRGVYQVERIAAGDVVAAAAPAGATVLRFTHFGGVNGRYAGGLFRQYELLLALDGTHATVLAENAYDACDNPVSQVTYQGLAVPLGTGIGKTAPLNDFSYSRVSYAYNYNNIGGQCNVVSRDAKSASAGGAVEAGFVAAHNFTPTASSAAYGQVCRLDFPTRINGLGASTTSLYLNPASLIAKTVNGSNGRQTTATQLPYLAVESGLQPD